MRDLLVAFIVFGSLPFILRRPFLGILMLAGLGYMNPHRLCYGFMLEMPVVQIVAIATLLGMLFSKEAKRMIWSREIVLLIFFVVWMGITTSMAFYQQLALVQYEKVIKIQILTFMTLLMLTSERRVYWFIAAIVFSLGFYGVKGGIFTILNGGVHRVQGPPRTFIGGNNELALALVMTIPLMRYLQLQTPHKMAKIGLAVAMLLTAVAAFGSQSRGALVALIVTGTIFWLKSRKKLGTAVFIVVAGSIALSAMPEAWFERMQTIQAYDEDKSAQGRINQWGKAINMANDRVTGGGFEAWQRGTCERYAPNPNDCRDVHSIYFEILGEHGYVGLAFFLAILGLTWLKCSAIIRRTRKEPSLRWASDLAAMIQVSMVGYMSAGTFLGLAYFDYIYHLIAVVVVIDHLAGKQTAASEATAAAIQVMPTGAGLRS